MIQSYTSVRGAKMNVPIPEPQIASPGRQDNVTSFDDLTCVMSIMNMITMIFMTMTSMSRTIKMIINMVTIKMTMITCDKGSFLVEVLGDTIQSGQVDYSKPKP